MKNLPVKRITIEFEGGTMMSAVADNQHEIRYQERSNSTTLRTKPFEEWTEYEVRWTDRSKK